MSENPLAELHLGRDGPARAWKFYLPADSRAIERFHDPVSIILKGEIRAPAQPPTSSDQRMKVYVGENPSWLDTTALVDAFTQLWPEALRSIARLAANTVSLVYFAAQATRNDLYDLWPYMPFGDGDEERYFVSEVCKKSRTRIPACGWVCTEYDYDAFKRMAGADGFGFRYGTTIMGISVSEAKAAECLRLEFLDKNALKETLVDDQVRCWWFCDADFEGMTIWHKDVSGPDLLRYLQDALAK